MWFCNTGHLQTPHPTPPPKKERTWQLPKAQAMHGLTVYDYATDFENVSITMKRYY